MPPRTPARAEVVGSLLRPARLREAMSRVYAPEHRAMLPEERSRDLSELRQVEDACIAAAVRRQVELGLDVVSDGEFRRYMFLNSFWDAVEGFSTERNPVVFRNAQGETALWQVQLIEKRLRVVDSPAAREARYLASVTKHPFKVALPAPSIFVHPATFKPGVTDQAYPSLEELVAHVIEIERGLVAEAVEAGARYVQLDFPLYPYLVDPGWMDGFAAQGHDRRSLLEASLRADNALLDATAPGVTRALHVCRGNYRSKWLCQGSLEPVAEEMFGGLHCDAFLVEWDDRGRDGGYEPIRFVPPGKTMVMGVISSKTAELEPMDEVLWRMEEAARLLPLEQLAISTQCGFASVMEGNDLNEEAQWHKLALVARVADRLWR